MANSNTTYILPSTVLYPVGCMGLRSLLLYNVYILLYCPARHWHWSGRLVTMSTDCQWTITLIKVQFFPLFICSASCVIASVVVSFWAIFGLISITQFSLTDCYINTHSARNVGTENTHRSVNAFLRWHERKATRAAKKTPKKHSWKICSCRTWNLATSFISLPHNFT